MNFLTIGIVVEARGYPIAKSFGSSIDWQLLVLPTLDRKHPTSTLERDGFGDHKQFCSTEEGERAAENILFCAQISPMTLFAIFSGCIFSSSRRFQ